MRAALRLTPADNIVDMRTLTGNRGWDTLHILLPGTNVEEYLKNFRSTIYVSGQPILIRRLWWNGKRDTNIKHDTEEVIEFLKVLEQKITDGEIVVSRSSDL